MGREIFPQNCPFPVGSRPVPNTWFLGPTAVHTTNGISVGSSVLAQLTVVTDRQAHSHTQTTQHR